MGKLATWIREYLDDDEMALLPEDSQAEVRANTWSYDVVTDAPSSRPELVAALQDVLEALRQRWAGSPVAGQFYSSPDPVRVWVTAVAGTSTWAE